MSNIIPTLTGRNMFIWRLEPVVEAEIGPERLAEKAKKAQLSAVWIKIAVGASPHANVSYARFTETLEALRARDIGVWGWTEPRCATVKRAHEEADVAADLAAQYELDGVIMDAERPEEANYFHGGVAEGAAYSEALRKLLDQGRRGLAICSHDIPENFPGFPFDAFAAHARVNAPQVYYGGSPSVAGRLSRAEKANAHVDLPFVPVGAAWLGGQGGFDSATRLIEWGKTFIDLVHERGYPGYSFWHWAGAPLTFWKLLYDTPA